MAEQKTRLKNRSQDGRTENKMKIIKQKGGTEGKMEVQKTR